LPVTEKKKKDDKKTRPKVMTKRQKTLRSIRTFLIYAAIFVVLRVWVIEANVIPSGSMKDSLLVGDYLIVEKISIYAGGPHRGDIATFDYPFIKLNIFRRTGRFVSKLWGGDDWGPKLLIKRVIGEPGDTIEIKDGVLYINDKALDEPYLKTDAGGDFGPIEVPDGHYFMMGDNRYDSADSRYIGAVPKKVIRGKARICYFSFTPITCPKHGVPVIRTPDGNLTCPFDGLVVGEPGDTVERKDGVLYVNGEREEGNIELFFQYEHVGPGNGSYTRKPSSEPGEYVYTGVGKGRGDYEPADSGLADGLITVPEGYFITKPDYSNTGIYTEITREGFDATDTSPLRLDERIRWFRIGMLLW
jgi:signal peptidase I